MDIRIRIDTTSGDGIPWRFGGPGALRQQLTICIHHPLEIAVHRSLRRRGYRPTIAVSTVALAVCGALGVPTGAQAAAEQISNGTFDSVASPWYAYGHLADSLRIVDGALCVDVPGGTSNPWDVAIGLTQIRE